MSDIAKAMFFRCAVKILLGSVLLVMRASLCYADDALPPMTVAELEKKMLDSRRQIRSGVIVAENHLKGGGRPDTVIPSQDWFDHDAGKQRRDSKVTSAKMKITEPYRRIVCRNCEKAGYYVMYEETKVAGGETVVNLAPLSSIKRLPISDLRLIGFLPSPPGIHMNMNLETALDNGDRMPPTITREKVGSVDCYLLSFDTKAKFRQDFWVAPKLGYAVLRARSVGESAGRAHVHLVENELQFVGPNRIWFPKTSTATFTEAGKVMSSSVYKVKSVTFNEPINDRVFTLAGMGLRKGVLINAKGEHGSSENYDWNGEAMIEYVRPDYVATTPTPSGSRNWLYAVAAVFAFLALAAIGFYWWNRPQTKLT